jgi:hypothetical protein
MKEREERRLPGKNYTFLFLRRPKREREGNICKERRQGKKERERNEKG